ncbi:MAG: DUF58 domain-containing protein [Deltaproteobacteria bacterium]|nr:DUF58 domain-containing protein [Deltaproteobacteria bacterium]
MPLELLRKIRGIQLRTQRLVTDVFAGEYESAFKGRGMEFEQVRNYLPGDDVRHIDWNVTARMHAPFVKEHREERELTVMLLVDVSSSGTFGSVDKSKNEIAAEVAALLAYVAIKSHDRVGLIIFTDRIEHYVPPKKGRSHVWQVIRDILTFKPERRATDLAGALDYLRRVVRRRAVGFVISDFLDLDDAAKERLRVTAKRHELVAVTITDPREMELTPVGILELEDAETGEVVSVDTREARLTQGFALLGRRNRDARAMDFRGAGIGQIDVRTDHSYVDPIVRYFHARDRR